MEILEIVEDCGMTVKEEVVRMTYRGGGPLMWRILLVGYADGVWVKAR
jgi:hypothetical protein